MLVGMGESGLESLLILIFISAACHAMPPLRSTTQCNSQFYMHPSSRLLKLTWTLHRASRHSLIHESEVMDLDGAVRMVQHSRLGAVEKKRTSTLFVDFI